MREIFYALKIAQAEGLSHRNLIADNILVKTKLIGTNVYCDDDTQCPYTISIVNFGQYPNMQSQDLFEKFGFSQLYCIAPEQIINDQSSLYYTDVWACGIIMYLMFSGTHPFKAQNNFDLCSRILNDEVTFNSKEWQSVSKAAKQMI